MRREYAKAAGWTALIALASAGVTYAVRGIADLWLWLPLGLGVALAAVWAAALGREAFQVVSSRRARQGGQSLVYAAAVLTIVLVLQSLAVNSSVSVDLTKDKAFTLSEQTVKTVKGLTQKVEFLAFYGASAPGRPAFEDLLKRVRALNPARVGYDFVDPVRKPLEAQEYGVREQGTTVVVCGDRKETLTGSQEEDLLNALLKVSAGQTENVYFLAGHQEADLGDSSAQGLSGLKTALESDSFQASTLNLATAPGGVVPEDAAVVVLAGPRTDLMEPELKALTDFLGRGGRIFVALDPRAEVPRLRAWLAKAGIVFDNDIVIDMNPFSQLFGASPVAPIVNSFDGTNPATKDLSQQHGQALFPQTSGFSEGTLPPQAAYTELARTLPTAFGWTGKGDRAPTHPGPRDKRGPVAVMVSLQAPVKDFGGAPNAPADENARLVAMGSSVPLQNRAVGAFNNQDLIVNSLRWLSDQDKRIALAPKPVDNQPLYLNQARARLIHWSVVLLALGALAAGVAVSLARRRSA